MVVFCPKNYSMTSDGEWGYGCLCYEVVLFFCQRCYALLLHAIWAESSWCTDDVNFYSSLGSVVQERSQASAHAIYWSEYTVAPQSTESVNPSGTVPLACLCDICPEGVCCSILLSVCLFSRMYLEQAFVWATSVYVRCIFFIILGGQSMWCKM